jgi:HK97 family phage major capsid protein
MPTAVRMVGDLSKLELQQAEAVEAARVIKERADAEGRSMTEEEEEEFERQVARSHELHEEYLERFEENRRAAHDAVLADAVTTFQGRPTPSDVIRGNAIARVVNMRDRWEVDKKRGFVSMGDFATSVYSAALDSRVDERLTRLEAALTVGSGADGGWLMPPEFSQLIWNRMNMGQVNLLSMVDSYPITGESLTLLANAETSRQTGSRWGGVRAYWVEDGEVKPESSPRVRRLKLEPHPLAVLVRVDNTLMKNPAAVERLLNMAAPDEIIFTINDAIINGDGVGKPLGILQSGALVVIAPESGQTPFTIVKANIDKMWARLHLRARPNSVWLANQDVDPSLEAMVSSGTVGMVPVFLPSDNGIPSIAVSPNRTLKGRPIMEIEQAMSVGNQGDIILCDLMYYAAGVRGGLESDMSIHLWFDRNQTAFRFVFYVDGQPFMDTPLTPFHGNSTISPFVVIGPRLV